MGMGKVNDKTNPKEIKIASVAYEIEERTSEAKTAKAFILESL